MKHYHPATPSLRGTSTVPYRKLLSGAKPKKSLTHGFKRDVGRDGAGRISVRHKGGGHKRRFREIDFRYNKVGIPAKVETIEYDPNRSGFIALICYADGERRYILAPNATKVGDSIITSPDAALLPGNRLPLAKIPVGTMIYNISLEAQGSAKLVRSAGAFAEVLSHDAGRSGIKLPSTEVRQVSDKAWASIGTVSNEDQKLASWGKAGRSRWKGIRPTVRGSAMNPVDHPYGGGEGRQGRGTRRPKTMWGKVTGGRKTRRAKKYSNRFIVSRRKKK